MGARARKVPMNFKEMATADVPRGRRFEQYPKEAIIDWHRRRGLLVP